MTTVYGDRNSDQQLNHLLTKVARASEYRRKLIERVLGTITTIGPRRLSRFKESGLRLGGRQLASCFPGASGVVGGAGDFAAGAGPIGVDEFASWLVDALVGVGAEVVALGLEQVGGETLGTVAVKKCQGC